MAGSNGNTATAAAASSVAPRTGANGGDRKERRKLVIVGSGGTGKTSLLMVYARGAFPSEYVPTVFENYVTEVAVDKRIVDLALWDTAGQEDYDRLRPLSYPESDVIVLCYAVNDRASLEQIGSKWAPEVDHFCRGVPKILVALKTDLRSSQHHRSGSASLSPTSVSSGSHPMNSSSTSATPNGRLLTTEEGQEMAIRIGADRFIECSAKYRDNVDTVFESAMRCVWDKEKRSRDRARHPIIKALMKLVSYLRCK